jgi:tetratricopeptide (TPR) repeat protein
LRYNTLEEGRRKLKEAIQAGTRRDYSKATRILEDLIAAFDSLLEPPDKDHAGEEIRVLRDEILPLAWLFLGRSLHAQGDYSRSLTAFGEYIRLAPNSPEGYRFAGRTYLTLGLPQRAIPLLEKARDLRPADASAMALLGSACLKARHSQAAVDILRQAVEAGAGLPSAKGIPPENPLSQAEQKRLYRAYLNALFIRGIRLCRNEHYETGIGMLRFVLENGLDEVKNIPLLRLELGRACRETNRLDEAAEHYTHALNHAPDDTNIRWYRASILMSLGRNQEALEDLEIIRRETGQEDPGGMGDESIPPNLPWNGELVDRFMIRSFLAKQEWRKAADAARSWLRSRGQDSAIHAMYAEAQRNLGEYRPAINHLHQALKLAPREIQLWYAMILTSFEGEDWDALNHALKMAENLGGDGEIIRRFSALLEIKTRLPTGDTTEAEDREAVELLQNAIRIIGPEPDIMYLLGERYLKLGYLEGAVKWLEKTKETDGNHEKSYLALIAAWEELNREALPRAAKKLGAAYDQYLALWPDNRGIHRDRALFLVHQGDFRKAAPELEALLPREPQNPTLRRLLAYCYRKTGRYKEAAFYLKGLLKEKPEDTNLLLEYSLCLSRAGAASYAILVLEKAMEFLNPGEEAPLALGKLLFREKKIERAFDMFRRAAEKNKKNPEPWEMMAAMARELGDREGVLRYEREAKKRKL